MSDIAISVENLGKMYRIGAQQQRPKNLREAVQRAARAPFEYLTTRIRQHRQFRDLSADLRPLTADRGPLTSSSAPSSLTTVPSTLSPDSADPTILWALRDVSFEVKRGEVLGIIGHNGAGKSTLLKILSRITDPSVGRAILHGRLNSLLEVGTGFHPELTGRENIYLSASIFGMRKAEIDRKFDEIVAFSEIDKFIDTPVKRYSSGMYVRLAFGVAAHLEPDILLVDEVLAVGDVTFQKKCLGKMSDVAKQGRTILYVSHNLPSVINLCQRVVLLEAGKIIKDGPPADIVQHYLATARSVGGAIVWPDPTQAPGNHIVRLHAVRILQEGSDEPTADVDIAKDTIIQIDYWNLQEGALLYAAFWLKDRMGTAVLSTGNTPFVSLTNDLGGKRPLPKGLYRSTCRIPGNFLNEGLYTITPISGLGVSDTQILLEDFVSFTVHDTGEMRQNFFGGWIGTVRPRLAWQTERLEQNAKQGLTSHL